MLAFSIVMVLLVAVATFVRVPPSATGAPTDDPTQLGKPPAAVWVIFAEA